MSTTKGTDPDHCEYCDKPSVTTYEDERVCEYHEEYLRAIDARSFWID